MQKKKALTDHLIPQQEINSWLLEYMEQTSDLFIVTDADSIIEYINHTVEKVTGYTRNELIGQHIRLLKSGVLSAKFYNKMWLELAATRRFEGVFPNKKKNGKIFFEEKVITQIVNHLGVVKYISRGRDISEKVKAKRKLELFEYYFHFQEAEYKRNMLKSFIRGQEEERKRVSLEIHDGLCQVLAIAKMTLVDEFKNNKNPTVELLKELLDTTISEARRISNVLSPTVLLDFGLVSGLKKLCNLYSVNARINPIFRNYGKYVRQDTDIELVFFRVAQEALTNAIKHSGCSVVYIILNITPQKMTLRVIDNGKGMPASRYRKKRGAIKGNGITNIRERVQLINASLLVSSKIKKFTCIKIIYNTSPYEKKDFRFGG